MNFFLDFGLFREQNDQKTHFPDILRREKVFFAFVNKKGATQRIVAIRFNFWGIQYVMLEFVLTEVT